jgi:Uma2 family endonuclease
MSFSPQNFTTFSGAEPVWEIATLFPSQGSWSVDDYLDLTDSTNRLIEFTNGQIEVLEMPTTSHQLILAFLYDSLKAFVKVRQLGIVVFAALRVRIDEAKFREPDVVFIQENRREHVQERYWTAADLVIEIVSGAPASRDRDLVKKRADYAAAKIPEYWIVDPLKRQIFVLVLEGDEYVEFGAFAPGQHATSRILPGFAVDVTATFDAAKG